MLSDLYYPLLGVFSARKVDKLSLKSNFWVKFSYLFLYFDSVCPTQSLFWSYSTVITPSLSLSLSVRLKSDPFIDLDICTTQIVFWRYSTVIALSVCTVKNRSIYRYGNLIHLLHIMTSNLLTVLTDNFLLNLYKM